MTTQVLVAFATKYGSTQEVAETVAGVLRERGLAVDLQPMRKVRALADYRAVVLGAPIYIGSLHKDAQQFLARYQETLSKQPTAIFALGPTRDDKTEWEEVRAGLDQELAKLSWFKPIALEIFGGKYDPTKLRFPDSLLKSLPASPLHDAPASDLRDWTAIRTWANDLAAKLESAL